MSSNSYTLLDFASINQIAQSFADHIEANFQDLADILLEYESYTVVQDEAARTLDLLRNLRENKKYFTLKIGEVTSFLPRNQPLYSLTCFVIVPSLMASKVHFRIPHSMQNFFPDLLKFLQVKKYFPNISVSSKKRLEFLIERTALKVNPNTEESIPVTDAVIFTGVPYHAERLRLVFDKRTLFVLNGAGHNPIIVSEDANVSRAINAVLNLQLYNQGQDCAAPNAVLVHKNIFQLFLSGLRKEIHKVKIGRYRDRSCSVGPISDYKDLSRIQNLLVDNHFWLDSSTPGIIRAKEAIVEPVIINKPLKEGGNFQEAFAPIMFLQRYNSDEELALYFENPQYARNAMYISVYGTSVYVRRLIGREINGKILHDEESVLYNIHLHAPGVERGTKPFGGYGDGASSLSINGKIICKPTLPQRDIFEWVVKPFKKKSLKGFSKLVTKDIQKLLEMKTAVANKRQTDPLSGVCYIDSKDIKGNSHRYTQISPEQRFFLLEYPNIEHVASMFPQDIEQIRILRSFLLQDSPLGEDELMAWLYALVKRPDLTREENREWQLKFFRHIYQLLFGKDFGPHLGNFLLDAEKTKIYELLDI